MAAWSAHGGGSSFLVQLLFPTASTPLLGGETRTLPLPLCGPCDLSTPTRLQPPHKRRHFQLVPSSRFLLECSHHHRRKREHAVGRAPSGTSGTSGVAERSQLVTNCIRTLHSDTMQQGWVCCKGDVPWGVLFLLGF